MKIKKVVLVLLLMLSLFAILSAMKNSIVGYDLDRTQSDFN